MTVVCKTSSCPYNDNRGFCAKEVVGIDEMGMCSVLWRRGQQREVILGPDISYFKNPIIIIEENLKETIEKEEEKEAAEVPLKDPLNGDPAS